MRRSRDRVRISAQDRSPRGNESADAVPAEIGKNVAQPAWTAADEAVEKNGCVAGEKGELIFADENVEKMEIVMKNYEKDGKTAHDVALCAGEEK